MPNTDPLTTHFTGIDARIKALQNQRELLDMELSALRNKTTPATTPLKKVS